VDYPFTVPGYEHVPLVLRPSVWKASVILYNGVPLEKTGIGKYRLMFSDGSQLDLQVKPGGLTFTPQVVHGNDVIKPVPPLPAYAIVFIYLPLALIAFGGAIGGGCGGAAAAINAGIFRSDFHPAVKILLSLLSAMGAILLWLVFAVIFGLAFPHH
jgi:hypothetical protein